MLFKRALFFILKNKKQKIIFDYQMCLPTFFLLLKNRKLLLRQLPNEPLNSIFFSSKFLTFLIN